MFSKLNCRAQTDRPDTNRIIKLSPPEQSLWPSEVMEDAGCSWGPNSSISVSGPGTKVILLLWEKLLREIAEDLDHGTKHQTSPFPCFVGDLSRKNLNLELHQYLSGPLRSGSARLLSLLCEGAHA